MKNIYNEIKIMKNIIEKLDEVVTDVLDHNEIIFFKGVLNSYISELESEITLTMTIDEIKEEIEKEIKVAEAFNDDFCPMVSADLLRYVLVVLKSLNPELEITNQ